MNIERLARTDKGWKFYSYSLNDLCEGSCVEVEENGREYFHITITTPMRKAEFDILRDGFDLPGVDGVLAVAELYKHDPQGILKNIMKETGYGLPAEKEE